MPGYIGRVARFVPRPGLVGSVMRLWSLLLLTGCAAPAPVMLTVSPPPPDQHVPDYARRPFEPFSRTNAIAIALREWRAFGSVVDDGPPRAEAPGPARADNQPGLWQRVGDYWWFGQDAGTRQSGWTPRYDEFGYPYPAAAPAWSAAFISYIMRAAGAGDRFTYSPLHADYINAAVNGIGVLQAGAVDRMAPASGDIICMPRGEAKGLRFQDLPAPRFTAHCDLVVAATSDELTVVGGNVGASVTMKHVPVAGGLLATGGRVLDGRYNWFAVLRVRYDG